MKKYPDEKEWQDDFDGSGSMEMIPFTNSIDSNKNTRQSRWILLTVVCLCVVVTSISLTFALKNANQNALPNIEAMSTDDLTQDDWRGAFTAQNIYEECYQSAVTVKLGRNDNNYWSGFIIDSDGWIVTSLEVMDASKRGKIYVAFNDGKEYSVESIFSDKENGVSLLKISATSLNAVEFCQREMQGGERVICVGALEYGSSCVLSGEICGALDDSLKINIGLDMHGTGAPLFDEDGYLVGMATARDFQNGGKISYAVSAQKCKDVLERIK